MDRPKLKKKSGGGSYLAPPTSHKFISSGCTLMDLVLGGGWALGRMANIIGDKSTGKTLLAIEGCANFAQQYPKGKIWYRESEAAFDEDYAASLGMPVSRIDFGDKENPIDTVEDMAKDLKRCCEEAIRKKVPGLYILDSMDALSDAAEKLRDFGEATFGTGKSKANSELFRKLTRLVEQANVSFIIISQVRAKIGAMFGDKTTRSGGSALDFYASQIIKLSHLKTLVANKNGVKRATGVRIKAKCTKNKIGLPFRDCEFVIRFAYGVESYEAGLGWLIEVKRTRELDLSIAAAKELLEESAEWDSETLAEKSLELDAAVRRAWQEIEVDFMPTRKKYG